MPNINISKAKHYKKLLVKNSYNVVAVSITAIHDVLTGLH